jgi:hypothetical protein
MRSTRAILSAAVVMTFVLLIAATAMAHHSFVAFNMNDQKTVTGTVKQVEWTNPHIWIWIDVPNDKGVAELYGFEGMSPNFLERRNWTRTTLKAGDKITVTYRPLRDGKNGGMFMDGRMTNGTILTMGGGRNGQ